MTQAQENKHIIESRPFWKRPAFYATLCTLIIAWSVEAAFFYFVRRGLHEPSAARSLASMFVILGSIFGVWLIWFTYNFVTHALCHYSVAVGDAAVTLFIEPLFGRHKQVTVRAQDIDYMEHFTSTDKEAIVCHLKNGRIVEIPLWCFPESAAEILRLLKTDQVQVLTV